jgi:hypothetical protein
VPKTILLLLRFQVVQKRQIHNYYRHVVRRSAPQRLFPDLPGGRERHTRREQDVCCILVQAPSHAISRNVPSCRLTRSVCGSQLTASPIARASIRMPLTRSFTTWPLRSITIRRSPGSEAFWSYVIRLAIFADQHNPRITNIRTPYRIPDHNNKRSARPHFAQYIVFASAIASMIAFSTDADAGISRTLAA